MQATGNEAGEDSGMITLILLDLVFYMCTDTYFHTHENRIQVNREP